MKTGTKTNGLLRKMAGLMALAVVAGCTPQQQQKAETSAEQTLSKAASGAEKALDTAGAAATKAVDKTTRVVSDASITATVTAKLLAARNVPAATIRASTKNNVVTLSGTVKSAAQRNQAIRLARSTPGANRVVSQLKIKK